jgi:hypothetical protein
MPISVPRSDAGSASRAIYPPKIGKDSQYLIVGKNLIVIRQWLKRDLFQVVFRSVCTKIGEGSVAPVHPAVNPVSGSSTIVDGCP